MIRNYVGVKANKNRVLQQFRLPPDLSEWLAKKATKDGKTKTQILVEALRAKMAVKA